MPIAYSRAILPVMAVALLTAGVAPANTINIDNSPAPLTSSPSQRLTVAAAQENSPADSFSMAIDGDYSAFGGGSPFFAGGAFQGDGPVMLSFELTAGYAPDTGILHAIRALIERQ